MSYRWKFIMLLIIVIAGLLLSIATGQSSLSLKELWETLLGEGTARQQLVLFQFRMPRMLLAFLVGAALALAGMLLQAISRNALADSGILGINAGSGLSMMLFLLLQHSSMSVHPLLQPLYALIGGLIVAVSLFLLSYDRSYGIVPVRLLYTGIAIASAISALMVILTYVLDPSQYGMIKVWMAGNIGNSNWSHVLALLPWLLVVIPFIYRCHMQLDILQLSDATTIAIGAPIYRIRGWLLVGSVLLVAPAVSVSGSIGFVGLIVPHATKALFGHAHRRLIPANVLAGGGLVLASDAVGKVVIPGTEIPAGIIVALLGAPYFVWLLMKSE